MTIEDTNVGSGDGQVSYSGSWPATGAVHFNDGTTTSAYYLVKFTGLKIAIYGGKYPDRGYAAFSVCSASGSGCGSEARVSNYSATMRDAQLLWQSGDLTYGQHTVKVRTTNTSDSQTGKIVDFDYAIVN
jgi:hypothetical protein